MNHSKLRDDDAEKCLIGCLLIDPRRVAEAARILRPEHFFDSLYRAVFEAAVELNRRQQLVEVVQILRMVRERKDIAFMPEAALHMADAGIFADHVTHSTVTAAHAVYYARLVAQTGLRRTIAEKSSTLHEATDTERDEVFGQILALEKELNGLEHDVQGPKLLSDECLKYLDTLGTKDNPLVGLGLPGIDYAIGGGAAFGEMVVMGARPSHGKTMCAMQILEHCAEKGLPGLIVSEEMSSQLLAGRSLLHQTRIASEQWRARMAELLKATEDFFAKRARIQIAEPCGTVKAAVSQIERAAASGVRVVAVDYAQLLKGKGANRYEQVTNVSMELKQACTRLNILLVLLCQLSRPSKERSQYTEKATNQKRGVIPTMTDLRDSGQLEQDADVILFLQWPLKANPEYKPYDRYFVYVEKNRNRVIESGEIECRIVPSRQLLEPLGTPRQGDPEYIQPIKELDGWN